MRQLNDTKTYKCLQKDLNQRHLQMVSQKISKMNFDDKTKDALLPNDTKCPHFYLLPKLQKAETPGRPIVAGTNCPIGIDIKIC